MDKYLIILEKSETGFSAYSPDVLGCIATGENLEETRANMQSAIAFHIREMIKDSEQVPQPRGIESYLMALDSSEGEDFFLTYVDIQTVIPNLLAV